jgi:hypothetical protein
MMVGPVSTLASVLLPPAPVLPPLPELPLLPPVPPLLVLLQAAATVAVPIKVKVNFKKSLRFIE